MKEFDVTDNYDLFASQGQRFLNFVIDYAIRLVIIFCLAIFFALLFSLLGFEGVSDYMENMGKLEEFIFGIITILIYYVLMESIFSRTIAKFITGTIVVMRDGTKPDSQTILKRTLCRLIPFDALSFFGNPSRGWHDSMSDTFVVKKADFDTKKALFYDFEQIGKYIED